MLHRRPATRPQIETTLAPGELITAFRVPAAPMARRSLYLKIRDRQSYEFALASAAVALDIADGDWCGRRASRLAALPPSPGARERPKRVLAGKPLRGRDRRSDLTAAPMPPSPAPSRASTTRSRSSWASARSCARCCRPPRWRSEMSRAAPDPQANMGQPSPRIDARLKVTGEARYGSDLPVSNPAYAVPGDQRDRAGPHRRHRSRRGEGGAGRARHPHA